MLKFICMMTLLMWGGIEEACAHDPHQAADYLSITPNPESANSTNLQGAVTGVSPAVQRAIQSIILRDHIWNNPHITICFGPSEAVAKRQQLVQQIISIAKEWQQGTKLSLDFGNPSPRVCENSSSANIRIDVSLPSDGNGLFESLIGNEAASGSIKGLEPFSTVLLFPDADPYYQNVEVVRFLCIARIRARPRRGT